jgi:hypothetical protein
MMAKSFLYEDDDDDNYRPRQSSTNLTVLIIQFFISFQFNNNNNNNNNNNHNHHHLHKGNFSSDSILVIELWNMILVLFVARNAFRNFAQMSEGNKNHMLDLGCYNAD